MSLEGAVSSRYLCDRTVDCGAFTATRKRHAKCEEEDDVDHFVPGDFTFFCFFIASSLDQSERIVCDGPAFAHSTLKPET